MTDITTALQDAYRGFCIQAHGAGLRVRNRLGEQRGQTAAGDMVDKIAGGNEKR